jgi:hypothetical protein
MRRFRLFCQASIRRPPLPPHLFAVCRLPSRAITNDTMDKRQRPPNRIHEILLAAFNITMSIDLNTTLKPDKSLRVGTREEPQLHNANTITNRNTKQRFYWQYNRDLTETQQSASHLTVEHNLTEYREEPAINKS